MRLRTKYALQGLLYLSILSASAQNEDDALRYSQYEVYGTGRFTAMNGAFSALGGDFSSIHINPAATGVFRKTDISYTPYWGLKTVDALHGGKQTSEVRGTLKTGNFGFVSTHEYNGSGSAWRSGSFSVSIQKLADFNTDVRITGPNTQSSLLDVFTDDIAHDIFDEYGSNLAWQTYLVDTFPGNSDSVFNYIPVKNHTQENAISTSGYMRETALSYGANYDDKLYIGGGIGFIGVNYSMNNYFSESIPSGDTNTILNSYYIQNNLNTDGSGVRFNVGLIYRPLDFIRIGLAAHTRAWMSMEDSWTSYIEADYDTFGVYSYEAPVGAFDYRVSTPARYNAGIAVTLQKIGLVSFDYEYVDYKSALLKSKIYDFGNENGLIQTAYQSAHNVAGGVEFRVKRVALRGGVRYQGNVYSAASPNQNNALSFSGGIGYKSEHFYTDLGLLFRSQKQQYYMYDAAYTPAVSLSQNQTIVSCTIGVRF